MIQSDNFISTIGYDGAVAVVDKSLKDSVKNKNIDQLLAEGEFRTAAALALHLNNDEEKQKVINKYNEVSNSNYKPANLAKLFGIGPLTTAKITVL